MKKLRRLICLLFVASCVIAIAYYVKVKMVEDTISPTITVEEDTITVSVKDDTSALLQGLTASDNRDGDLTESIRVDSMSHFIGGTKRNVNYVVFDQANNIGTATRTVVYNDYIPTRIRVTEPFLYTVREMENVDLAENIIAYDCIDGDISNQVRTIFDNNYYYGADGIFSVTLEVSNSVGDVTTIPMEATILSLDDDDAMSKEYPYLTDYVIFVKKGQKVDLKGYIRGLVIGGNEYEFSKDSERLGASASDVKINKENLDLNTPGIYTVVYSYKGEGVSKAETKLVVVVEGTENE